MMRWSIHLAGLLWLLVGMVAVGQELPTIVTITLKNGVQLEGPLIEQTDEAVTIEEEFAGGTITQTTTILRTNIAELVMHSAEETKAHTERRAYENLQRYQLNPASSFSSEYYLQVINNVFQPFLEQYPASPHANEVAEKITQWQEEYRQVAGGKAKYRGRWVDADDARREIAAQHAAEWMSQARQLMEQRAYDQAIEKIRYIESSEAQTLRAEIYQRWLKALDDERDKATAAREEALQRINLGLSVKQQMDRMFQTQTKHLDQDLGQSVGPTADQIIILNRAQADIVVGSNNLQNAESRLAWVEQQVDRLRPLAKKAGLAYEPPPTGTGEEVVSQPVADVQAPKIERETDWDTPRLLRQAREFWLKYWPGLAIGLVIVIWYVTRKLSA